MDYINYKNKYLKYKRKYLSLKGGAAARDQGDSKLPEIKGRSVREITLDNINNHKKDLVKIFIDLKQYAITGDDAIHYSRFEVEVNNDNLDEAVKSIQYMLTFINTVNSDNEKKNIICRL